MTSPVSFLVLEAGHRLRIPANVGVCVGEHTDPRLLRRGVEILFADKTGYPKFLGVDRTAEGFARNGYPIELARQRAYSGCHWSAIPGREYTLNDCVKINFARVFEVAFKEMIAEGGVRRSLPPRSCGSVSRRTCRAPCRPPRAASTSTWSTCTQVFPELVLDLLCYGPIEKGLDASHGGVEFYNLCVDGAALATVADSFAALEQRVEQEERLTWDELQAHLQANWAGAEGERARLMMQEHPALRHRRLARRRVGQCASRAPSPTWSTSEPHPARVTNMIPGLFSWANTIPMGKEVGATPNGRHAGDPISHGANPDPGFRKDGAPTAMAVAIASVQPGYGNTAPMQIELDPLIARDEGGVELVASLIRTHFDLGGTQINLNIMDAEQVLEAHKDPSKYPDLVVRVTGFSAYFASLSPEFRQLVVDRIISS